MTALLLPAMMVAFVAVFMLIAAVAVAVRQDVLQPVTVDPFYGTEQGTSSSDTAAMSSEMVQTVLVPKSEWQSGNFRSLSQVEDMLDTLEAHGFASREVVMLTDDCFTVRWK